MNKKELLWTRVALLSVLLLSGHTVAYGQKAPNRQNPLLPDVHLGLNKLGVDAILTPLAAPTAVLPILPSLSVPGVAIGVAPPIVSVSANVGGGGVGVSVTVPPIGGLTPPLGTNVNVQLGDGSPGTPPHQNVQSPEAMLFAQGGGQMPGRRLDLIPTCR